MSLDCTFWTHELWGDTTIATAENSLNITFPTRQQHLALAGIQFPIYLSSTYLSFPQLECNLSQGIYLNYPAHVCVPSICPLWSDILSKQNSPNWGTEWNPGTLDIRPIPKSNTLELNQQNKPHLGCSSPIWALQTYNSSQMIFPMVLTAENNFYELQFGKMPLPPQ